MKNLGQLMKQAQDMQTRMSEMQARLESAEVEGQAGAGMVQAVLSGKGDLKRVKIDPSLLVPDEAEILEDLIVAAHNDAKAKLDAKLADGRLEAVLPDYALPSVPLSLLIVPERAAIARVRLLADFLAAELRAVPGIVPEPAARAASAQR